MLLAYLRGLLKPNYDQGIRSFLRENMIIEALSLELDADYVGKTAQIQASYAPLMKGPAARELIQSQQVTMQNLRHLSEFDDRMSEMTDAIQTGEQADLIELYTAMASAGLVGENAKDLPPPEDTAE